MYTVLTTQRFDSWFDGLRDARAKRMVQIFKRSGLEVLILLAGGDKSTQGKDIKAALKLARELSE